MALTLTTSPAVAGPRLDYEAPPACPDRDRFSDEVSARLGKLAFDSEAADSVSIRIVVVDSSFEGEFRTADGVREVQAPTCSRVFAELVTVTSLALDDDPVGSLEQPVPNARIRVQFHGGPNRMPTVSRVSSYGVGWGWTLLGPIEVSTMNLVDMCVEEPCDFELPPGEYELVASAQRRVPARTRFVFVPGEDAVLRARLPNRSRQGIGRGLAVLGAIGMGVGSGLLVGAAASSPPGDGRAGAGLLVAGGVVGLVAIPVYLSSQGSLTRAGVRTPSRRRR